MPVPLMKKKSFIRSGEGTVASYSWTDFAENTGNIRYYLAQDHTDAADHYFITGQTIRSNDKFTEDTTASATFVQVADIDFDILFNVPARIRGTAYASISLGIYNAAATGVLYCIANVRKYDGTTETEFADGQSAEFSVAPGVADKVLTVAIDLSTQQKIIAGEKLRITIEVFAKSSGGDTKIALYHDPADRNVTWNGDTQDTTQSYVTIPFILDL